MKSEHLHYYPQLDGLRGLAIMAVICGHVELINAAFIPHGFVDNIKEWEKLFWMAAKFGWMGVDLFFVLSGYLIMRIIVHHVDTWRSWCVFLSRRALRIFPLFFVFLSTYFIATLNISSLHLPGSQFQFYFDHQLYLWCQTINFLRYQDVFLEGELTHLWSLAVEEQFYVILPTIVLLSRTFLVKSLEIIMLLIGAVVVSIWVYKFYIFSQTIVSPPNVYVSTFMRGESILAGSLIAMIEYKKRTYFLLLQRYSSLLMTLGIFVVGIAIELSRDGKSISPFDMKFTGYLFYMQALGFSGLTLAFSGLLLYALRSDNKSLFLRSLNNALIKSFGAHCYSIYMLNTLVVAILAGAGFSWPSCRLMFSSWSLPFYIGLIFTLCWLLAKLTYMAIEGPALKLKRNSWAKY